MPTSIRAVTFDVGGTLIEPWPSVGQIYAEVAARFGLGNVAPEALNRQFVVARKTRRHFDYSRLAWQELVNRTFAGLLPGPLSISCFAAIYEQFGDARSWRVFDDVRPTLADLKARGLKLGLISNWDERLRPLLSQLQLTLPFNALVISHEVGQTKPAPGIFRRASALLGLAPELILHVGDSATEDVAGAEAAGMPALLLDRSASATNTAGLSRLGRLMATLDKGFGPFPQRS